MQETLYKVIEQRISFPDDISYFGNRICILAGYGSLLVFNKGTKYCVLAGRTRMHELMWDQTSTTMSSPIF